MTRKPRPVKATHDKCGGQLQTSNSRRLGHVWYYCPRCCSYVDIGPRIRPIILRG